MRGFKCEWQRGLDWAPVFIRKDSRASKNDVRRSGYNMARQVASADTDLLPKHCICSRNDCLVLWDRGDTGLLGAFLIQALTFEV